MLNNYWILHYLIDLEKSSILTRNILHIPHPWFPQVEEYIVERKEVGKKSWKQVVTSSQTTIEIRGLKKDSSYNFRVIARNSVGCSEPFIIEETFTAAKADIKKSKQTQFTTNLLADFEQLFFHWNFAFPSPYIKKFEHLRLAIFHMVI